jgi:hypothetical protein
MTHIPSSKLPTCLLYARNFAVEGQFAETKSAQAKFAVIGARSAAQIAAIVNARLEFRMLFETAAFDLKRLFCHMVSLLLN